MRRSSAAAGRGGGVTGWSRGASGGILPRCSDLPVGFSYAAYPGQSSAVAVSGDLRDVETGVRKRGSRGLLGRRKEGGSQGGWRE
jgi:hypothetical protein